MNGTKLKFSLLQIAYWCGYGAFISYASTYFLTQRNFSAGLVGTCLSIFTLCGFLGQLFWSGMCDYLRSNRKVIMVGSLLTAVLELLVFRVTSSWGVCLAYGILGFVVPSMAANMDAWILCVFRDNCSVYGPIRSAGSLGYALFMLWYGNGLLHYGYGLMLGAGMLLAGVSMLLAWLLPDVPPLPEDSTPRQKKFTPNRQLTSFMGTVFLIGLATVPLMGMMGVVMNHAGGSVEQQGYCLFISAVVQVPLMMYSGKLHFWTSAQRLVVACAFYLMALLATLIARQPWLILLAGMFNGIAYGLMLPAMRELIFQKVPIQIQTTMQGITDALYNSLAPALGSAVCGFLADGWSIFAMNLFCVVIQCAAMMLAISMVFRRERCVNI